MFIAAFFFIIAKTWMQWRWPSESEWIQILWYIQRMENYSVLKINEMPSHEKTQRRVKCILKKRKKPICKDSILYDFNHLTFWKRQCWGGKNREDFFWQWQFSVWYYNDGSKCHYTFVWTHKMYITKSEL